MVLEESVEGIHNYLYSILHSFTSTPHFSNSRTPLSNIMSRETYSGVFDPREYKKVTIVESLPLGVLQRIKLLALEPSSAWK